jgi:hypothetical protein
MGEGEENIKRPSTFVGLCDELHNLNRIAVEQDLTSKLCWSKKISSWRSSEACYDLKTGHPSVEVLQILIMEI